MDEVAYTLQGLDGDPVQVTGVQVGRFAVRFGSGQRPGDFGWCVDHVPSGTVVSGAFFDFAAAMVIADDVSRFAGSDPDATELERVLEQVGPDVVAWIGWLASSPYAFSGFRAWASRHRSGSPWADQWRTIEARTFAVAPPP